MSNGICWQRNVLANGMRILLLPKQSANTTQLSIGVEYGSNNDPSNQSGVAHFIEHMLAGGSTNRIELSRSIENNGGILDFFTDHEHTMSILDVMPKELRHASSILEELLFSSEFEEEKFSQEKKIILHEIAEISDSPNEKLEELLLESLFRKHSVRNPVLGKPQTINRLSLTDLKTAYQSHYEPQNMILALAGKFSNQDRETIIKKFGEKKGNHNPITRFHPETQRPKSLVVRKKAGLTQAYLGIGAKTVCSQHKDAPTLDLISTLLGGSTSSRFFILLRETNALTYDINCDHNKGKDFGFFSVNCAVKNENLERTQSLIFKEFDKLKNEAVSADELARNKNLIVAGILRSMDRAQESLEIVTYLEMQYRSERSLEDYISEIKAVSADKLMNVANQYFQEDNLTTVLLTPK